MEIPKAIGQRTGLVTLLGFILVFVVLLIFYRRISFAAITMIPVMFGTVWTFGTLGIIGIPLTTALVGIFSMIIGLGIDFGIHIVHRFEENKKTSTIETAIHSSVKHVGRGLTLTSITTIIGFLALLSATLPALKDMAIALSFGVIYSLMGAIVLIPAVLVLVERGRSRKQNKKQYKGRRSRK